MAELSLNLHLDGRDIRIVFDEADIDGVWCSAKTGRVDVTRGADSIPAAEEMEMTLCFRKGKQPRFQAIPGSA